MKQEQFLDVVPPEEARARWHAALDLHRLDAETVILAEAWGRVLAADVAAPGDVPAFDRSNVDGFAVRAEDTFGASERDVIRLRLVGDTLDAGRAPTVGVGPGEALPIATGAVLPRGADAVVMVEDTEVEDDGAIVRVHRPVVPGGRVSAAGSDVTRGETVLRARTRLTARETGTLAACGFDRVPCVRRPRVGILSTGNEIVAPGTPLAPGQVHDANATLIADAVREIGAEPVRLGAVPDDTDALDRAFGEALSTCDVVLLSGGTSKGGGDLSYRVLERHATIHVHGVALKPGKPLCLAAREGRAVAILPGFPTSAIFTFHAFVAPVIRRLLGIPERDAPQRRARLPRAVRSERGRREFTLVTLLDGREGLLALPLGKGSGSVTTFARADGFFEIPADAEFAEEGEEVQVTLLGREIAPADLVVVGSHCTGLDALLSRLAEDGVDAKWIGVGSHGGLDAARLGACDLAPVHLYDPATGAYNNPFVPDGVRLLPGYGRRQGLAYRPEHAPQLGTDGDGSGDPEEVAAAVRRAAADPALRIANRNPASGTRALLDDVLGTGDARPAGWTTTYRTHGGVAAAVAQRRADWGVCLEAAARGAGLCWRPLKDERYDFLVPEERWEAPGTIAFRGLLESDEGRALLRAGGFEP